jgi:hypothetical protein
MDTYTDRLEVNCTKKDAFGVVSLIVGKWGNRGTEDVIEDLNKKRRSYYLKIGDKEVDVLVYKYHSSDGLYIRTDREYSVEDHLKKLPDCPY